MLEAARRVQEYGRHDAGAVRRLLEEKYPIAAGELEVEPLSAGKGPTLLGEVAPPTFDDFASVDHVPNDEPAPGHDDPPTQETGHGA